MVKLDVEENGSGLCSKIRVLLKGKEVEVDVHKILCTIMDNQLSFEPHLQSSR